MQRITPPEHKSMVFNTLSAVAMETVASVRLMFIWPQREEAIVGALEPGLNCASTYIASASSTNRTFRKLAPVLLAALWP